MTFSYLYFCVQGYVPALSENRLGMSCSETFWLLGGAWFQCKYGGFWMSSYQLMFPGVRNFLEFLNIGLSLLPLASNLIHTVASRFLHPYSTNDKTSRLMEKKFSTVRDTQRHSQSYMEKRRGRREIEVTGRSRGRKKGREQSSQ